MKLVLLHALPLDHRMWNATVAALAAGAAPTESVGIETVAPDLFTLGSSIDAWAAAVLDLVGPEPLIVVGCSVGGSCALEIARAAPKQVQGLVLVGAKAEVRPEPNLRDDAIRLLEADGMAPAWDRYWGPLFAETTSPSVVAEARSLAMAQDIDAVVNGVRAFHNRRDLSTLAATWDRPLIGISGAADLSPQPAKLCQLATGEHRTFHLVPDCGHYVNLEQPVAFELLLRNAIRVIAGQR